MIPKALRLRGPSSEKFTDDGYYCFQDPLSGTYRIMWASEIGTSIALSDNDRSPVELVVTGEQFDEACWGVYMRVSSDGFPIQRRRP